MEPFGSDSGQEMLQKQIQRYYRLQSPIYDATRWTFLFGRGTLLQLAARSNPDARTITEFGCGTGTNLRRLAQLFPKATLTGLDLSADMLKIARRRTAGVGARLQLHQAMDLESLKHEQDLIVFSYCLSMINPGWQSKISHALKVLKPGGLLAVVDFHTTPLPVYRRFMAANHVTLSGAILPHLQTTTTRLAMATHRAYFGCWTYMLYLGRKNNSERTEPQQA